MDDSYNPEDGMDLTSQGAGTYWSVHYNSLVVVAVVVVNTSSSRCKMRRYAFLYFYTQKQLLLYHILAIAILSVRLSVCHMGGSVKNGAR